MENLEVTEKYILSKYKSDSEVFVFEDLEKDWKKVFYQILKNWGFNKKAIKISYKEGVEGNWDHLHLTKEEETWSPIEWYRVFRNECFYCSDRWSLDRLFRCHWIVRQLCRSLGKSDWDIIK